MTMNKTRWLQVGLVCLALWPAHASAQGGPWKTYMATGAKAYQLGNYPEAEKQFAAALKEAEGFVPQDSRLARSLNNLAAVYRAQGKYGKAEPLLKRALANDEKALGPDHTDVATDLNNLALVYQAQGKSAEAEPPYKRALAIWEKALGSEHPNVATALENYATLLRATGRHTEAAKLEARAQQIRAKRAHEKPTRTRAAGPPIQAGALTNYGVHFASYENLDLAQQGWSEIWRKHWQMLTGVQPYIDYASLRGGQPQYRLYGRGLTKEQAEDLCWRLQLRNEPCAVISF